MHDHTVVIKVLQVDDVDAILVPVGSGGLIAGTALAVKKLDPRVKVIVCRLRFSTMRLLTFRE